MDSTASAEHSERRFKFRHGIISDVGLKREENQDSYGYAHTRRASIFIVADGMGGARGGATASAIAVHTILRYVFDENGDINEATLREGAERANEAIFERSRRDESLSGMGTTAVVLAFSRDRALLAHVGDSRAYFFRNGSLKRLTRDHTLVQELVESGAISPSEAAHHPIAHMLTRSLGPAGAVEVDVNDVADGVQVGDRFLLCCDGLYNLVQEDEIRQIVSDSEPDEAAQKLLDIAIERGAPDNVTIQVICVHSLDDNSINFTIPEEGKIRLVTSSDEPEPLPPETEPTDPDAETETVEAESVGENAAATKPKKKKKKKRVNALDKVIFRDAPSAGDEEVEEEPPAEAAPVTEESKSAESAAEDAALEETEPSAEELKALQKLQRLALGVIFFTIGVVAVVVVSQKTRNRPENVATVVTPTSPVSAPTATLASSSSPSNPVTETTAPAPSQETETSAPGNPNWPAIDLTSETNLPEELRSIPPEKAPPETKPTVPEKNNTEKNAADKTGVTNAGTAAERAAKALLAFEIPPVPKLKGISVEAPVEPINWEKEKAEPGTPPKFFSDVEKMEMTRRKTELRDRLADTDAKLLALDMTSIRQLEERERSLSRELDHAQELQVKLRNEFNEAKNEVARWQERKRALGDRDAIRIADEVAQADEDVREKKGDYDRILSEYQTALGKFQENQKDEGLLGRVSALARDMKAKRAFLEQAVIAAIDRRVEQSLQSAADKGVFADAADRRVEQLNRHVGILNGAQPNISGRNRYLQESLLDERAKTVEELRRLIHQFPDTDEEEFLHSEALKLFSVTSTARKN